MRKLFTFVLCLMVVLLLFIPPAFASWSGSYTFTIERAESVISKIHTTVLEYEFTPTLMATTVVDYHDLKGTDLDFSLTQYTKIPFLNILYTTVGVRHGVYNSDTPLTTYLSITYRF